MNHARSTTSPVGSIVNGDSFDTAPLEALGDASSLAAADPSANASAVAVAAPGQDESTTPLSPPLVELPNLARANGATNLAQATTNNTEAPRGDRFEVKQQWEGIVQRVESDEFVVRLHDLAHEMEPTEATLPIDEIAESERKLVSPGAVLYWTIGYRHLYSGQLERVSLIWMRRVPGWSTRDVARVERRAAELRAALTDDDVSAAS